jgi:hypothetical protein
VPSNINSTTPAAPAGNVNVIFQTDGAGNDSGYVPKSATSLTPVDLTAQDANIPATPFFTAAVAGRYRIGAYIIVTTPDGASSTLPSITITWTDADNTVGQSFTLTPTNAGNTTTTFQQAEMIISAVLSGAVQYTVAGYASGTPTAMKFAIHLTAEAL